eukprot:gene28057-23620_t
MRSMKSPRTIATSIRGLFLRTLNTPRMKKAASKGAVTSAQPSDTANGFNPTLPCPGGDYQPLPNPNGWSGGSRSNWA